MKSSGFRLSLLKKVALEHGIRFKIENKQRPFAKYFYLYVRRKISRKILLRNKCWNRRQQFQENQLQIGSVLDDFVVVAGKRRKGDNIFGQ